MTQRSGEVRVLESSFGTHFVQLSACLTASWWRWMVKMTLSKPSPVGEDCRNQEHRACDGSPCEQSGAPSPLFCGGLGALRQVFHLSGILEDGRSVAHWQANGAIQRKPRRPASSVTMTGSSRLRMEWVMGRQGDIDWNWRIHSEDCQGYWEYGRSSVQAFLGPLVNAECVHEAQKAPRNSRVACD